MLISGLLLSFEAPCEEAWCHMKDCVSSLRCYIFFVVYSNTDVFFFVSSLIYVWSCDYHFADLDDMCFVMVVNL